MNQYNYEYTDTFGGEANYSWVKRGTVKARDLKHAFRLARKELDLSGVKGRCEAWDHMAGKWVHHGCCTVLFVSFDDSGAL